MSTRSAVRQASVPVTEWRRTDKLQPGDRLFLPLCGGHIRTVATVEPAGYVNHRNEPIYTVRYVDEGLPEGTPFREGNTCNSSGVWQFIVEEGTE